MTTPDAFARIERELHEERALALRRVAETFETTLAELASVGAALDRRGLDRAERRRLVEAHARLRERARLYRWYLIVQREAIGFFRHEDLALRYPIPAAVAE